jgi:hypothetical protein
MAACLTRPIALHLAYRGASSHAETDEAAAVRYTYSRGGSGETSLLLER